MDWKNTKWTSIEERLPLDMELVMLKSERVILSVWIGRYVKEKEKFQVYTTAKIWEDADSIPLRVSGWKPLPPRDEYKELWDVIDNERDFICRRK